MVCNFEQQGFFLVSGEIPESADMAHAIGGSAKAIERMRHVIFRGQVVKHNLFAGIDVAGGFKYFFFRNEFCIRAAAVIQVTPEKISVHGYIVRRNFNMLINAGLNRELRWMVNCNAFPYGDHRFIFADGAVGKNTERIPERLDFYFYGHLHKQAF